MPIAPKSAAGEGVTLKVAEQSGTNVGSELMRTLDDSAQLHQTNSTITIFEVSTIFP